MERSESWVDLGLGSRRSKHEYRGPKIREISHRCSKDSRLRSREDPKLDGNGYIEEFVEVIEIYRSNEWKRNGIVECVIGMADEGIGDSEGVWVEKGALFGVLEKCDFRKIHPLFGPELP